MKNTIMHHTLLPLSGVVFLVFTFLSISVPPTPIVHASDPTLDAALAAIAQATIQAQHTKDAREQDLANQRATVAALDLAQRRQAATWTAQAQARDAEATQVARTATASFVQTQVAQTAVALATQQMATANASATSAEKTRVDEQAQSDNATRTTFQIQALQTSSAQQTQAAMNRKIAVEERDANVRTVGSALLLGASLSMLLAVARWVWTVTRPRTVVQIIDDATVLSPSLPPDESPVIERVSQDPVQSEPIIETEPSMPPVRVIIDDDLAEQAQILNDLLKQDNQDSQDDCTE